MSNIFKIILIISTFTFLTACVQTTPKYDQKFGQAVSSTLQSQIINKNAGLNAGDVTGIDGNSANNVITNYQKSFATPEKTEGFNIGVGSNSSGSSAQ